ncbi:MAG: hypothetical protein HKN87_21340 [Saprospiraceae bacterium]|nr:hypothetical protein [Saprospiraceae bacterium]
MSRKTSLRFIVSLCLLLAFGLPNVKGQEAADKPKEQPVRSPYEAVMLVDFPTTKTPAGGAFEYYIHHRFGTFENGWSDLQGIYAPSNIRMGLNYGLTRRVSIGFGTEKNHKMQEFNLAYRIFDQTRSNKMPVAIMYYGNVVIDARNKSVFGVNYEGSNRLSYFNQLIVSRKFSKSITLHTALSFSHFNSVDSLLEHDKIAWHFAGRVKLWSDNSFIFEYTQPLEPKNFAEHLELTNPPKAGLSLGLELGTSTHAFQVFVSNYQEIIPQQNVSFNQHDFWDGQILIGFNMTVRI